jgi:alpha-ketoglutarate-dependent taurine dioxygenase
VLEKNSVNVNWKESDILILNNLLISHGRRKYTGKRKVFVVMTNDK